MGWHVCERREQSGLIPLPGISHVVTVWSRRHPDFAECWWVFRLACIAISERQPVSRSKPRFHNRTARHAAPAVSRRLGSLHIARLSPSDPPEHPRVQKTLPSRFLNQCSATTTALRPPAVADRILEPFIDSLFKQPPSVTECNQLQFRRDLLLCGRVPSVYSWERSQSRTESKL